MDWLTSLVKSHILSGDGIVLCQFDDSHFGGLTTQKTYIRGFDNTFSYVKELILKN